uniref:Uncharacterized protein n=1 Tax=Anguilla anguilla TaxID=7936 RepID=A0A0E9TDB4_ANGAN
MHVSEIILW